MNSLSHEIREVITKRLRVASALEVIAIAGTLCADDPLLSDAPIPGIAVSVKSRFEVDGDTVTDSLTGLMWTRGNAPGGRMAWADAQKAAAAVRLGGHDDWRLPTVRELLSIVDYERSSPSINTDAFQCESAWYWSATPYQPSPGDYAWGVGFDSGVSNWGSQAGAGFVRAVRAGQLIGRWVW